MNGQVVPEAAAPGGGGRRYEAVVIGGGAAGLSGALTLGRARRSVLVVDDGRPRNAPAGGVHVYLGREGTPPGELLAADHASASRPRPGAPGAPRPPTRKE
ncbi:FAD-binding protein, partial [Marinitenerispora sediminis]